MARGPKRPTRPGIAGVRRAGAAPAAPRAPIPGQKTTGVGPNDLIVSLKTGATWGTVASYLARKGFIGERRAQGLKALVVLHRTGRIAFREGAAPSEPASVVAR